MTNSLSKSGQHLDVPALNIRLYRPGQSRYANRISDIVWDQMRPDLEVLHASGATRRQMLEHLTRQHNCRPTPSQLNARMVAWGMKAYKGIRTTPPNNLSLDAAETAKSPTSCERVELHKDESIHTMKTAVVTAKGWQLDPRILDVLNVGTIIDPESFCTLQDLADIFGHSGWAFALSYDVMKALVHAVESDCTGTDLSLCLLLLRNCAMWPAWWSSTTQREWLVDRLGRMGIDAIELSDFGSLGFALDSSDSMHSYLDLQAIDASIKAAFPNVNIGCSNWPYDNTLFSVTREGLMAGYGSSDLAGRLDPSSIDDLLSWCSKELHRFNLPLDRFAEQSSTRSDLLVCHIELVTYFFDRWTKFVEQDEVIVEEGRIDVTELEPTDDLFLFRIVARMFSITSYLATSTLDEMLLSASSREDSEFSTKIKTALLLSMSEMQLKHTSIFEQMRQTLLSAPWVNAQEECCISDFPLHTVENLTILLTKRFSTMRRGPPSHRCLAAFRNLRRQYKIPEPGHSSTGPDATLWYARSTSSFKSFRRAGISSRDRFRPPSTNSLSSRYSISSNKSNIILTSAPIVEEWNFDEMEIDKIGNTVDDIVIDASKLPMLIQQ